MPAVMSRANPNSLAGLELDRNWIGKCFMLPKNSARNESHFTKDDYSWMYFSSADTKYTNTSLGGNFTVNNPPQFTVYADPPTGKLANNNRSAVIEGGLMGGMGQYYSEAIDDNAHRVTMRFGVPEYKGLITFFTSFYNADMALLGNQGRTSTSMFYFAGKLIGLVAAIALTPILMLGRAVKLFLGRPNTSYYWVKPAMPLYWSRVNMVVNRVAANMGLVPEGRVFNDENKDMLKELGLVEDVPEDEERWMGDYQRYSFDMVKEYMPEIFSDEGGIDIYRVINKTARMEARAQKTLYEMGLNATGTESFAQAVRNHLRDFKPTEKEIKGEPLKDLLLMYHKSILGARTMLVNGEEVDVTYRDGITDRIEQIAKEPPRQTSDQQQQATDANGQPVLTTPDGGTTAPDQDSPPVNAQATPTAQQAANPPPQSSGATASTGNDTSLIGSQPASSTEVALSDGMLGAPPSGQEAKDLLKEYAAQDSRITSILTASEDGVLDRLVGWLKDTSDNGPLAYFGNTMSRGSDWISFKVDPQQEESESWSNTSGEAEITSTINGVSSTARAARFSFSNFQTGFGLIDEPVRMFRDTVSGLMDGFQISGLLSLAGSGAVDIPKRYMDSSVNLTSNNYTIELRSAYGDPLSIFMNLYVPFLCLLAAALPVSHGSQSYGAPLMCEMYNRGRSTVRTGLIESIQVRRGVGTVGWNADGLPLGIDVSFSVVDMSNIMHMPIDTGLSSLMPWNGLANTDTVMHDYLAVLSNLSIADQVNMWRRLSLRWAAYKINIENYFNSARFGNWVGNWGMMRMISQVAIAPPKITNM